MMNVGGTDVVKIKASFYVNFYVQIIEREHKF
jgi:hypothetical protein